MTGGDPPRVRRLGRWMFHRCLRAYPTWFRARHGTALWQTFSDRLDAVHAARGPVRAILTATAECVNVVGSGIALRWRARRDRVVFRRSPLRRSERIHSVWQDLRYAARTFARQPGFMVSALLLLALGIGANTAVLSLANAYLLRPLPFPESDRLVRVGILDPDADVAAMNSIPRGIHQVEWPAQDEIIEHLVAWDLDGFSLVGDDQPESVDGAWVTPGYFGAVETRPFLGRVLTSADGESGAAPVVVISHGLWMRRFGGDSSIVGRSITAYSTDRPFDPEVFTVVGVLPPDFWFVNRFTDFLPALTVNRMPSFVRLRPGVTVERAREHFTAIVASQADRFDPEWTMFVRPAHDAYVRQVRPVILVLSAAVGLVLLIACGNVAMLLIVRALGREREFGIRRALGASRSRVVQQLLIEGGLLSGISGAFGVVLAGAGLATMASLVEQQMGTPVPGGVAQFGISGVGLAVALGMTAATGLAFGLIPAIATAHRGLAGVLCENSRGVTDSRRRRVWRNVLIVGEVAISLALLISAGLMIRTVRHLSQLELGFVTENVLKANVSLRLRSYPDDADRILFTNQLVERVQALPGVTSAGVADTYPFRGWIGNRVQTESVDPTESEDGPRAVPYAVTPGYFRTMDIPLTRGRVFDQRDRETSEPVVIVSESLARQLWMSVDPIGQRLRDVGMGSGNVRDLPWRTVIGVVGDTRKTLTERNFPDMYVPYRQNPRPFMFVMARTVGDPLLITRALQQIVWELDPEQPLAEVESMNDVVTRQGARPRFLAAVLAMFAVFGVGLALYGLYSVVSYAVTQRRRDVAIRMALGAGYDDVIRFFLGTGGLVVGLGILCGLAGSVVLTRLLSSQLYGVSALDPMTYWGLSAVLFVSGLGAVWIPARRAARCDPMDVLRDD